MNQKEAHLNDTLSWSVIGKTFKDGSHLSDWVEIYQNPYWHWQYDTHELSFTIYQHDGQYWKLYHARYVEPGDNEYTLDFGGQACRMVLVEYLCKARSPHTSMLKQKKEKEWVRTYEYCPSIHKVLKAGEQNIKYGKPYEVNHTVSGT
jgi:hypothetical protein